MSFGLNSSFLFEKVSVFLKIPFSRQNACVSSSVNEAWTHSTQRAGFRIFFFLLGFRKRPSTNPPPFTSYKIKKAAGGDRQRLDILLLLCYILLTKYSFARSLFQIRVGDSEASVIRLQSNDTRGAYFFVTIIISFLFVLSI